VLPAFIKPSSPTRKPPEPLVASGTILSPSSYKSKDACWLDNRRAQR